jgi:uncharacterized membrane protein
MNKKRKWGIILIIIGLGIILFFLFFSSTQQYIEFRVGAEGGVPYEELTVGILGLEFPYKYPLIAGGIAALIGVGMICYSFFPKKEE